MNASEIGNKVIEKKKNLFVIIGTEPQSTGFNKNSENCQSNYQLWIVIASQSLLILLRRKTCEAWKWNRWPRSWQLCCFWTPFWWRFRSAFPTLSFQVQKAEFPESERTWERSRFLTEKLNEHVWVSFLPPLLPTFVQWISLKACGVNGCTCGMKMENLMKELPAENQDPFERC